MKCPKCSHVSGAMMIKCPACGEAFERDSLERLGHLEYLLAWLGERAEKLDSDALSQIRTEAIDQISAIHKELKLPPVIAIPTVVGTPALVTRPPEEIARELKYLERMIGYVWDWIEKKLLPLEYLSKLHALLNSQVVSLKEQLHERQVKIIPPSNNEVLDFALKMLPEWSKELQFDSAIEKSCEDILRRERAGQEIPKKEPPKPIVEPIAETIAKPAEVIKETIPVKVSAPPKIAKAAMPKFDWIKWWERSWTIMTSGKVLRGLLYLGAFMIVVSAAVLVIRFWDVFPQGVQLLFIASVPTIFFLAGWLVRTRLKLPLAGNVLTGIGALLVAVDFAAVYQYGGLAGRIDQKTYWLAASVVCTFIYILTAWRLRMEFFGHITIVGAGSTILALTSLVELPLEWKVASMSALAALVVEGTVLLERKGNLWSSLPQSGWRAAPILLLACMGFALFIPGNPALAQTMTFLFATIGFGLLARISIQAVYTHIAVWSSVGIFAFLFRLTAIPNVWTGTAVGVLIVLYRAFRLGISRRIAESSRIQSHILVALNYVHWSLLIISIGLGIMALVLDLWIGVVSLVISSLLLGWSAYLYHKPGLVLPAAVLFTLPFSLAIHRWLVDAGIPQPGGWLMAGWSGLALIYLGGAMVLRQAKEYGCWFNLVAHILTPMALFGLLVDYLATTASWTNRPSLVALGGVILVYATSAVIHDSGRHPALSNYLNWLPDLLRKTIFLWPIGFLLPIWMTIAWLGSILVPAWLGAALAGLGLVYVALGQLLARWKSEYHLPFQVYTYPLAFMGIVVALGEKWALLTALYIDVVVFVAIALIFRRAWAGAFAALLFIWPFQLSLELSPLTTHAYSLAYALLACLGYLPLAIVIERFGRKFALPLYGLAYAMAITAVVASSLGRFGAYELDIPWLGVVPVLIITGMLIFSTHYFRMSLFSWSAVGLFSLAFGQALRLFHVPFEYAPLAWVGAAFIYMLLERFIAWDKGLVSKKWIQLFCSPLMVATAVLTTLGLALTSISTFVLFSGLRDKGHLPLILAQSLAVGLLVTAARLYLDRWPIYIASVLSFFPYTLTWMGYGPNLTTAQFAWVWMGLAAAFLGLGFTLDRSEIRYSHGLYSVGYLLAAFALAWSVQDRLTLLYTLGAFIVLSLLSQMSVHFARHHSFDDFLGYMWGEPGTASRRIVETVFLFAATIGFPIWLTQLLTYDKVSLAWIGLALAIVAPFYIAIGVGLRRVKTEYLWPFYSVGYILTVIGAMFTLENQALMIYVLTIDAALFVASAYIFRQPFWLYLSNFLLPVIVLICLDYWHKLTAPWVASSFMALAFAYVAIGFLFSRRKSGEREGVDPFALPFYAPSYLLSAVSLAVASSEKMLALWIYSSGILFYAFSAWIFREPLFLYPTAWLAVVPYYLGMTLTTLSQDWYGIGWLPLIAAMIVIGRSVFHGMSFGIKDLKTLFKALTHPAMPFYLLAYALSLSMIILSHSDTFIFALSLAAGSIICFASAALFCHAGWLYPGLLTTHFAVGAFYDLIPVQLPAQYIVLPFLVLTWIIAWIGNAMARRKFEEKPNQEGDSLLATDKRDIDLGHSPLFSHLLTHPWARPFFLFAAVDIVVWQVIAISRLDTTLLIAVINAILLSVFATLWKDKELTYFGIVLYLVAFVVRLRWAGMPMADGLAWIGGIGLGLYFLALLIEKLANGVVCQLSALQIWSVPLMRASILLTAIPVLGTVPQAGTHWVAATAALGFAGILYLTIAYRDRRAWLGYLGLALLELDWVLLLIDQGVREPQLYAIPAGLYFVLIGYLERRQGRKWFAIAVESLGLAVLLVTSFIQSLNGKDGLPYFLLLLAEGIIVFWWGGTQRRKVPFFIGIGAIVLNVISQIVVLVRVYDVQRWIIILGLGVILVTAAVFVERKRERIIAQVQEWSEQLETWE